MEFVPSRYGEQFRTHIVATAGVSGCAIENEIVLELIEQTAP